MYVHYNIYRNLKLCHTDKRISLVFRKYKCSGQNRYCDVKKKFISYSYFKTYFKF